MGSNQWVKPIAFALSLGAVVTTSAVASQSSPPAAAKTEKDVRKAGRMVCRNLVMSGTRLSSRHCRSQEDWDREAREAQEAALAQQTGPGYQPEPIGGPR